MKTTDKNVMQSKKVATATKATSKTAKGKSWGDRHRASIKK